MKEYDNFSETFAKSRKNMHWPEIEYFMESGHVISNSQNPIKVLDIGCGSGRLVPYLQKAISDLSYQGFDSSEGMIQEAKKEHPDFDFQVLDMTNLDRLETNFDMVFFIASFHHLDSVAKRTEVLDKLKNMLSDKGIAFMTNWNLLGEKNFRRYEKMYLGNGDFSVKIGSHSRYYHSFGEEELRELFVSSGFEIIENRVFDNGNNIISIIRKK